MRGPLLLALIVLTAPLSGCVAPSTDQPRDGVVVTGQPILDAFLLMGEADELTGIPSWVATDEPLDADRIGTPFTINPETVDRLEPRLVLDQPHPLVTGPSRDALEGHLAATDTEHRMLPTEPTFATIKTTLDAVENATGTPAHPHWQTLQEDLERLNETLDDVPPKTAIFLFPAGLVAGANTDADTILRLAGLKNAAAQAGLEGYQQITREALQRQNIDLVIATSTLRETPAQIADKPMFRDTPIHQDPERVLTMDPSRSTRLGPHVADAATSLAAWAHPDTLGPTIHAATTPTKTPACTPLGVDVTSPDEEVTVTFLGTEHAPGTIPVPDVPPGHYRLHITAQHAETPSTLAHLITVEEHRCERT